MKSRLNFAFIKSVKHSGRNGPDKYSSNSRRFVLRPQRALSHPKRRAAPLAPREPRPVSRRLARPSRPGQQLLDGPLLPIDEVGRGRPEPCPRLVQHPCHAVGRRIAVAPNARRIESVQRGAHHAVQHPGRIERRELGRDDEPPPPPSSRSSAPRSRPPRHRIRLPAAPPEPRAFSPRPPGGSSTRAPVPHTASLRTRPTGAGATRRTPAPR